MVNILVAQCHSKEKFNRLTAINWMTEFISLGGTHLILYYSGILGSIMYCISDPEPDICAAAKTANIGFMNLVKATTEHFDLLPIIHSLTLELLSDYVTTRVASLHWINMLHEKDPVEMNQHIGELLPALLKTISDSADEVVLINLQVLARISLDVVQFNRVLNALVQLFMEDRPLLETRGAMVIRKLCSLLDSSSIYMTLAKILNTKTDLEFTGLIVQTLNLILLTAPELSPLRKSLKNSFQPHASEQDKQTFASLFHCWAHNPVATFSLCLLAQCYDLSAKLILRFAEVDVTVGFLMQIDKLIQLLESPIFIQLRLHLLETDAPSHADLLKSLYGLLMLLPQSQAYKTLSDRLTTVSSLHMHIGLNNANRGITSNNNNHVAVVKDVDIKGKDNLALYSSLIGQFEVIQEKHTEYRLSLLRQKSLLPTNTGTMIANASSTSMLNMATGNASQSVVTPISNSSNMGGN
mmetsp:Transcript_25059/g.34421  ORF Transcript_25059/g.34421 Transcript_25059/m.34421 type:complete len:468 (+) Transcript_25059:152-1555(+)